MFPPNQLALHVSGVDDNGKDGDDTPQTPSPPVLPFSTTPPPAYSPPTHHLQVFDSEPEEMSDNDANVRGTSIRDVLDDDTVFSPLPPSHLDEDMCTAIGATISRLSESACTVEYINDLDDEIPYPPEPPTGSPPTQLDLQVHGYYQHVWEQRYLDALPPPPNQLQERPIKELRTRRERRERQQVARKRIFERENAYKQPALRKDVLKASFLR